MQKNLFKDTHYKNDASCIGNKRGMAKRAKRHSNHSIRQKIKRMDKKEE